MSHFVIAFPDCLCTTVSPSLFKTGKNIYPTSNKEQEIGLLKGRGSLADLRGEGGRNLEIVQSVSNTTAFLGKK